MYPTHPRPLTPYHPDPDVGSYQDETWYGSGSSWLKVTCAYFMLILSLKMVWGWGLAHLSYTLWNFVIFRTLRNIFVLNCRAGVSMGHPPGDQLGDARIWSSRYLHHWKRIQVAAKCLSSGENCCRLLTTLCFCRWVSGWVGGWTKTRDCLSHVLLQRPPWEHWWSSEDLLLQALSQPGKFFSWNYFFLHYR